MKKYTILILNLIKKFYNSVMIIKVVKQCTFEQVINYRFNVTIATENSPSKDSSENIGQHFNWRAIQWKSLLISGGNTTGTPPLQIPPPFFFGAKRRKIFLLRKSSIKKFFTDTPPLFFPKICGRGGVSVVLPPDGNSAWKKNAYSN